MKKAFFTLTLVFIFQIFSFGQTELISDGGFDSLDTYWTTNSQYWWISDQFQCSSSPTAYAYFGTSTGGFTDNGYGGVYQDVYIPSSTISATFSFSYSINTYETGSSVYDACEAKFVDPVTQLPLISFVTLSNLNGGSAPGCQPYQTSPSYTIPSSLFGRTVRVYFQAANDGNNGTIFRIDDVSIQANLGCVTWINGIPTDPNVRNAAEYLCQHGVIDNIQDYNALNQILCKDVALDCYYSLQTPSFSDNFPTPVVDIQNLTPNYQVAIKAMLYLDYSDGIPCFSRDNFNVCPEWTISKGKAIRAILEAWGITPDTTGYDPNSFATSTFLCDLPVNNLYYRWLKAAFNLGFLTGMTTPCSGCNSNQCFGSDSPLSRADEYILLSRAMQFRGGTPPTINSTDYFIPNTFTSANYGSNLSINRAVFDHFEDPSFVIPGGGLPLVFSHSFHSNFSEYPYMPYEYPDHGLYTQAFFPLGFFWTHNYNIYILKVPISSANNANDYRLIINWGDGSLHSYDPVHLQYETTGIHDEFLITSYDSDGNANSIQITKPDGTAYSFSRDANMSSLLLRLVQIKDRDNNIISLNYHPGISINLGNGGYLNSTVLSSVTDQVSGRSLTFTYQSGTNYISSVADNSGRSISFNVNPTSKDLETFYDANGGQFHYMYGSTEQEKHLLKHVQKPNGNTIDNTYQNRKLHSSQNSGYSITVNWNQDYNGGGGTNSIVDVSQNGQTYSTSYTHDVYGNSVYISTPTGSNLIQTFSDPVNPNQPTSIYDGSTNISYYFTYDNKGNVLLSQKVGGGIPQLEQFSYNNFSEVTTYTDPQQNVTNYSYTPTGDLSAVDQPNGLHTAFQNFTSYGKPQSMITPTGEEYHFSYNTFGNLIQKHIVGTSIRSSATYDALSRVIKTYDSYQVGDSLVYDNNDNILDEYFEPGGLNLHTHHTYDANGNLRFITSPRGLTTELQYNFNTDDLIKEIYGSHEKNWNYNTDGSLNSYSDKRGNIFNYSYFPAGDQRAGMLANDGYATYDYNTTTKNLSTVSRNGRTISYGYDGLNRINSITYDDLANNTVQYEYDLNNNITKIRYPFNTNWYIDYEYDANNQLSLVKNWNQDTLVHYVYSNGRLDHESLGNGTSTWYFYDTAGRNDSICTTNTAGALLASVGCSFDNNSNHLSESWKVNFIGPTNPPSSAPSDSAYSLSYDNMNRITNAGSATYNHDAEGNLLFSSDVSAAYTWDTKSNLLSKTVGGLTSVFDYDPLENRRQLDSNRYALDLLHGANILVETDLSGNPKALYVYGLGLVCRIDPSTGTTAYYHYDFRGSTIAITDSVQEVMQKYKYDAWGVLTNADGWGNMFTNPFAYVGKYGVITDDYQLYYMRARYYSPQLGRFLSEDPVWGTNLYPYCGNNPVSNIDPNGNTSISALPGIFKTSFFDTWEMTKSLGKTLLNFESIVFPIHELKLLKLKSLPISELGKWGELRLGEALNFAGSKPNKAYFTSLGRRYFDRLVDGIAYEAKAGKNVKLNSALRIQILKDKELIDKGQIIGANWHFFQGADRSIIEFLESVNIPYTLH